jgi:hypothetical protein
LNFPVPAQHRFSYCINVFEKAIRDIGETAHAKTLVSAFFGIHEAGLCGTQHGFARRYLNVMHEAYSGIRTTLGNVI